MSTFHLTSLPQPPPRRRLPTTLSSSSTNTMKFFTAVVFALAATSAVVAQDDPCQDAHKTQASCDADTTTGGGCTWCKCAALPSACWTKTNAAKLPAGVYDCDSLAKLAVKDDPSCLTPAQETQLKEAITGIKATLDTVDASLLIAWAAEKDPTIKQNLLIAEKVISAVNIEIVNNLTKIAEEACGNCSQIVETIDDAVTSIEDTLTKVDPDWKTNPLYESIVAALSGIMGIIKAFCPNF